MKIKRFRYFYGFIDIQQRFINRMGEQGWRLIRTGRFFYEFTSCPRGRYQYCVDFIADKSCQEAEEYTKFLEEMGYRVMTKPINTNFSFGKIRIRPWGKGWGQVATTPGRFGKELLIVEKENDGRPFALHTTLEDQVDYYQIFRSAWAFISVFCAGSAVYSFVSQEAL